MSMGGSDLITVKMMTFTTYKVIEKDAGRFRINVATNDKDEKGIAIPEQHEMMHRALRLWFSGHSNLFPSISRGLFDIRVQNHRQNHEMMRKHRERYFHQSRFDAKLRLNILQFLDSEC